MPTRTPICTTLLRSLTPLALTLACAATALGQSVSPFQPRPTPPSDTPYQPRPTPEGILSDASDQTPAPTTPVQNLPSSYRLTGVVRDFVPLVSITGQPNPGGHQDFERNVSGVYAGMVASELGPDRKPVFLSKGFAIQTHWRNALGQNIMPPFVPDPNNPGQLIARTYIGARTGDITGRLSSTQSNQHVTSDSFSQWFRDVPGVNLSTPISIQLNRDESTGLYVFDSSTDPVYRERRGFFPINGQLLGNYTQASGGVPHTNYHFTFELPTRFRHQAGAGHTFRFTGDDDVWVFIDGKLVIDLGGCHGPVEQVIELDRLSWLQDGQTYDLRLFFAERKTSGSNCRITTSMALRTLDMPVVTGVFD